jgi:hypothetical protein
MFIKKCRSCNSKNLKDLFSLGRLSFTGKFAKNKNINIPKADLGLKLCANCKLVQLSKNFNLKYLYGPDYGYRTGINKTMTDHVRDVVKNAIKITKLIKNDAVLDIASNDGTLLNFYPNNIFTFGIDPTINKFKKNYKNINLKIPSFFEKKKITKIFKRKFKVISALSVFYDIENPNKFLSDVNNLLDKNGIFILEQADLLSIIKLKMFDTICHEHLEYYSHNVIKNLLKKNGLEIFDFIRNDINGASTQYYIKKINNQTHKVKKSKILKLLNEEKKYKLDKVKTFKKFILEVDEIKKKLSKLIKKIKDKDETIHGYGASTKGNVLLQYFQINKNDIEYIADRNPKKEGYFTPNTKIKIVSEKFSRSKKPNYYIVLPWHFKKEMLLREKKQRKFSKFIFPLPKLSIY